MSDAIDPNWEMTEIRPIKMPDGSTRAVVATKRHWEILDDVLIAWQVTPEEIAEQASTAARETGLDFDAIFGDLVVLTYEQIRDEDARIRRDVAAEVGVDYK